MRTLRRAEVADVIRNARRITVGRVGTERWREYESSYRDLLRGGQSVTFYPTRSTTGCACQPRHVRPGVTHAARYRTGLSELESGATARSRACWKRRIASIRWRVSAGTRRWIRCACRPRMHARGAAETVAYTGTEPCLTCAGLRSTASGHVVYSVAADGDVDFRGQLVRSFGDRTLR